MASIGPQLPKRKRTPEDNGGDRSSPPAKLPRGEPAPGNRNEIDLDDSDSDDGYGPSALSGPSLPPVNRDAIDLESGSESDTGPAPPPPRPAQPAPRTAPSRPEPAPESSSDDDSDDYGPALPTASTTAKKAIGPSLPPAPDAGPQRDEWMLAPPTASSFTERDPTRIRARKFTSKPGPSGPSSGVSSIWTETPEEKLQRLQDAVLGRGDRTQDTSAGPSGAGGPGRKTAEEEERDRMIAARVEAKRGGSLYDEHQKRRGVGGKGEEEEEDDPSKRGFDREKDMALGGNIGTAQRRELMTKSANFGGRFQKGSYL